MKVTIRDLFWLVLIAAVALGWWLDHARQLSNQRQMRERFKVVMDAHGMTEPDTCRLPPLVEGKVLATSSKDLVEISLGSDDGLKAGQKLQVHRGKIILGQITIRVTGPDRAVGQIDKALQRGEIQTGDNVTTKLGS